MVIEQFRDYYEICVLLRSNNHFAGRVQFHSLAAVEKKLAVIKVIQNHVI
jgi:hypothetical protein